MRPFTSAEMHRIQVDMDAIEQLWARAKDIHQNAADATFHTPPALLQTGYALTDSILGINVYNHDPQVVTTIAQIAAVMFEFGQFCYQNNVHTNRMQQCICCKVDEEDLSEILGGNNEPLL